MTKTLLPLCAALLLFPVTSFAAPAPGDSYVNDEGARVTENGNVREIVIDDGESVDGELLRANGDDVNGRPPLTHKNMINIRVNFLTQLAKLSADI